jgi:hypothetical protein
MGKSEIEVRGNLGKYKIGGHTKINIYDIVDALKAYFVMSADENAPNPLEKGKIIIKIKYPKG